MKKLKHILAILVFGLMLLDSIAVCLANPQNEFQQPIASTCTGLLHAEEAVPVSDFEVYISQQKLLIRVANPKVAPLVLYIPSIWQPPRIANNQYKIATSAPYLG